MDFCKKEALIDLSSSNGLNGMIENRKLYFLRNIEELSDSVKSEVIENEVIADAEVIGEFDYGPYTLSIWEIGLHNEEKKGNCA